jgi:hypothetical protein
LLQTVWDILSVSSTAVILYRIIIVCGLMVEFGRVLELLSDGILFGELWCFVTEGLVHPCGLIYNSEHVRKYYFVWFDC